MNYETLQTEIATRVGIINTNPSQPVAEIVVLPETEADYKRAPHERPRITVAYIGSDYGSGQRDFNSFDVEIVTQEETVNIELHIQAKRLYGASGLYPVLNAVLPIVQGYRPANCDKIHLKNSQLRSTEDGLFLYVLSLIVKTYAVQQVDATTAPNLTQVSFL